MRKKTVTEKLNEKSAAKVRKQRIYTNMILQKMKESKTSGKLLKEIMEQNPGVIKAKKKM